ncbi:MAG: TonB family protein [Bacteroidales bacterium]|nr:TonB family protein [Bacteroidales bacterium]
MNKRILLLMALAASLPLFGQNPDGVPTAIKDFLKMSSTDTTICRVSGVVTGIRSSSGGNFYIKDDTGELFIYGIIDPAHPGWGFRQMDIKQGDTLTLCGRRQVYNTTIEMTSARLLAKSNGPDHDAPIVFDREPTFKGKAGAEAKVEFSKWIAAKLRYPKDAGGASGTVKVKFVIGTNGGVQEVQVVQGVNKALNDEAIRVVSSSPKWKPAILNGKPIRMTYTLPVIFYPPSE